MRKSIDLYDMPEGKNVEDYPEETSFTLNENAGPRYDRSALSRGELVKIYPGSQGYDTAVKRSELYEIVDKVSTNK